MQLSVVHGAYVILEIMCWLDVRTGLLLEIFLEIVLGKVVFIVNGYPN